MLEQMLATFSNLVQAIAKLSTARRMQPESVQKTAVCIYIDVGGRKLPSSPLVPLFWTGNYSHWQVVVVNHATTGSVVWLHLSGA